MFYCVNPNYRYRCFSPSIGHDSDIDPVDNQPTDKSKRNLINALSALYRAYGGEDELKNNAVDIIYKIADVVQSTNNASDAPPSSEVTENNDGEGEK